MIDRPSHCPTPALRIPSWTVPESIDPGPAAGRRMRRLIGAVVAVCAAGILGLAAHLEPSPTGLGTHSQLALPACSWVTIVDVPCPTCGMTTAFAHAANGDLLSSVAAQPLGGLLAVGVAMALVVGGFVAVTGSPVAALFVRLWSSKVAWALGLGAAAAWIYKILSYKGLLG